MDEIIKKTTRLLQTIFPDFETSKSFYTFSYTPQKEESETIINLMSCLLRKSPEELISKFHYSKIKNTSFNELCKEIISTTLLNKFNLYTDIIIDTLLIKCLRMIHEEEKNIQEDMDIFNKIIEKSACEFAQFLETFPTKNTYILGSNNIQFSPSLKDEKLTENLTFLETLPESISFISFNTEDNDIFNYFKKYKNIIESTFSLILGDNIRFFVAEDSISKYLKDYGCDSSQIDNIRNFINQEIKSNGLFSVKYNFDNTNFIQFKECFNCIYQLIKELDTNDYKKVSLDFYLDALKPDKFGASRITYFMIALEALFNVSKTEITKTIRQNCTRLLQIFCDNPETINDNIKKAYKIRCDYTHGTKREVKEANFDLINDLSKYTRLAILIFLQLEQSKTSINSLIEDSLIFDNKKEDLIQKVNTTKLYLHKNEMIDKIISGDVEVSNKTIFNI